MGTLQMKPVCVSIPHMEVSLPVSFFESGSSPPHLHSHPCFELVCVGDSANMRFIIIPPRVEHLSIAASSEKVCSMQFSFHALESNDVCDIFRRINEMIEIQDSFKGAESIQAIRKAVQDHHIGAGELLIAELRLFFVKMARILHKEEMIDSEKVQTLDEQRLAILDNYFSMNLERSTCSKQELAEQLGITERHLSRVLYDVYCSNFSAILLRARMSLANTLIKQGETNITQIACKVGYKSTRAFKLAYKKFYGIFPEELTKR